MIHVIATVELQPGKRAEFLAEFHRLMPAVHAEAGCIEYGPTVDAKIELPAPTALRADVVTIVEKWESHQALRDHLAAPHMADYRIRVRPLVKQVTLQVLEPA